MISATITSKGQITIPIKVRKNLHLNTGDKIAFELHGNREALFKPVTKSIDEVFGMLQKETNPRFSVAEINRAIENRMEGVK